MATSWPPQQPEADAGAAGEVRDASGGHTPGQNREPAGQPDSQGAPAPAGPAPERQAAASKPGGPAVASGEPADPAELALLFDLPALAVGQLDLTTLRYVRVNAALCQLSGYRREELLGRSFLDLTHPDERARDLALLESIRAGERAVWQVEKRLLRKRGDLVWVQVNGRVVRDAAGRPVRTLSTFADIGPLRATEERLEAILASIDDHLASYDQAWRFTYVNDAAAAVLGKAKEELLGHCIWELFPDAVGNQYYRDVHQAAAERRVIRSEFYYPPFDKWFENHIYPTATGVTVFSADVTWRKRAEALQRDAERRKDEFLAALSHELRNPLAPILAAARLMRSLDASDPAAAGRLQWAAGVVERQGQLLARLVDDLLDVSRITRGKIELRRTSLELAEIIEHAVETVRPAIDAAGHTLRVVLPAEPVRLAADPARLTQALGNVLHNAAKFTPPGGEIEVQLRRLDSQAEVRVRDNGPGIPGDLLERVFEMFEQGVEGGDRSGLGIGLTIVRRLVELHGGQVAAYSQGPGTGTEVVLQLPLAGLEIAAGRAAASAAPIRPAGSLAATADPVAAEPGPDPARPDATSVSSDAVSAGTGTAAAEPTGSPPAHRLSAPASATPNDADRNAPRRVLVVDDNADAAESLALLLEALGHQAEASSDGLGALARARELRPDLVLLDIGMPGMDGYEVARRLREEPTLGRTQIVALTGWGQPEHRERTRRHGFDHHLVKPVDVDDLRRVLAASPTAR